jgi:hypothetical protein
MLFFNRTWYHNGVKVADKDVSWTEVRQIRRSALQLADLWYLPDRWDTLTATQQDNLNIFRQALRDLPQNYDDPNDAADNWPEVPEVPT